MVRDSTCLTTKYINQTKNPQSQVLHLDQGQYGGTSLRLKKVSRTTSINVSDHILFP